MVDANYGGINQINFGRWIDMVFIVGGLAYLTIDTFYELTEIARHSGIGVFVHAAQITELYSLAKRR